MAALTGADVKKLKGKGGGKWKYMSEKDMLDYSAKFAPYRYVRKIHCHSRCTNLIVGACLCGTCGE